VVVFADVADPQVAQQLIGMLKSQLRRVTWETTDFQGTEIQYCKLNVGMNLSPAFAVHEGMVVAATTLQALRGALGQPKRQQSLARDAAFGELLQKNQGALVLIARADVALQKAWPLAQLGIGAGLSLLPGEGVDAEAIPTVEQMQAEVDDVVAYARVDADGVTLRQSSPVGLTAFVASAGAVVDWALAQAGGGEAKGGARGEKKKIY
jgi:hypothetical protein